MMQEQKKLFNKREVKFNGDSDSKVTSHMHSKKIKEKKIRKKKWNKMKHNTVKISSANNMLCQWNKNGNKLIQKYKATCGHLKKKSALYNFRKKETKWKNNFVSAFFLLLHVS